MPRNNFETERLKLRKFQKDDTDLIVRLNSDPEVMKHIGDPDSSVENAQKYLNMRVDGYADKDGLGMFVATLKSTGAPIGWFCLKYINDTEEIEIGFRLLKEYWNQGFATEGSNCLIEFGFKELGLKEIVGVALPTNQASRHVLEKIGLDYVGMARYYNFDLSYYKKKAADYL